MENPIRPDELGLPETTPKEPIKLRLHHLESLFGTYSIHTTRERFSRKPLEERIAFDQLYLHPEIGEEYLYKSRESSQKKLKRHLRGRIAKYDFFEDPKIAKEMAQDYTGKGGKNMQEYLDLYVDAKRELLLGDPDTQIDFTWGPDRICFSCQSTELGQPGKHCLIPSDGNDNEGDCYRALEYLYGLPEAEGKIGEITEDSGRSGRHSFTTTLGFLRSSFAMEAISGKYNESMKARFDRNQPPNSETK